MKKNDIVSTMLQNGMISPTKALDLITNDDAYFEQYAVKVRLLELLTDNSITAKQYNLLLSVIKRNNKSLYEELLNKILKENGKT